MELKPEWRDRKKCLKRKFSKINENQQTTYPRIPENLNWYLFKKKKKKSKKAKGWAWSGRKTIRSEKLSILKERRREWKNGRCYLKRRRIFFFHILIKNHVQTSRKKLKGKLLTKTNRGLKRSQSSKEGGWNQISVFSPDKLGKKLSQKSTREILAWQKYPKVLLQNAQVINSFHKHRPLNFPI